MKDITKRRVRFIGWIYSVTCVILMLNLFYGAYLDTDNIVSVSINAYGEAEIEFFIVTLGLAPLLYFLNESLEKIREEGSIIERKVKISERSVN